jgi:Putative auto-transporter adhesin, head GIN domain
MKKIITITLALLCMTFSFAQKKEKIKGSKIVTFTSREINNFNSLEISDNVDVYIEKGTKCAIKIEADDNIHEAIITNIKGETLEINTSKEITTAKKKVVWITYTADLKSILVKNGVTLNAITAIELDDININSFDETKLFLNVNAKKFSLKTNDKSQTELNLKSDDANLVLEKNSVLKALINAISLKLDLYQKTVATIEGDAATAVVKLNNNSTLDSRKLIVKLLDLTTQSYSDCKVFAATGIIIAASDKSEIQLLGTPKIEMRSFADEAKLLKKLK